MDTGYPALISDPKEGPPEPKPVQTNTNRISETTPSPKTTGDAISPALPDTDT